MSLASTIARFKPDGRAWAAIASGLLLAGAFPPLEWAPLAFAAFVPLLLAVRGETPRRAARLGFLCGAVFWNLSLAFLHPVTTIGTVILALYCSLYFIPVAWFASQWERRFPAGCPGLDTAGSLAATMVFTGFEYLRGTLLTGFPWNFLGVSQFRQVPLIQIADIGGAYLVSAVVFWVNALTAAALHRWRTEPPGRPRAGGFAVRLIAAAMAPVAAIAYGALAMARQPHSTDLLRTTLVQPAIPQFQKWTPEFTQVIYDRLGELTRRALTNGPADLIVWPETALPDYFTSDAAQSLLKELTAPGIPLLLGLLDVQSDGKDGFKLFNSAFLLGSNATLRATYDKQHLVLLGEYMPFQDTFPFLKTLSPIGESVTPGTRPTIFRLDGPDCEFAILICFEDSIPRLARRAVREGARVLFTITNDAWYDISSGSLQHMAQSVFRCVENRAPMVRCGNSGVSCWIDERGALRDSLPPYRRTNGRMETVAGILPLAVAFNPVGGTPTFYARHGDVFAHACAAAALLSMAALGWRSRRTAGNARERRKGQTPGE